jgi:hypothetical protein
MTEATRNILDRKFGMVSAWDMVRRSRPLSVSAVGDSEVVNGRALYSESEGDKPNNSRI